MRYTVKVWAVRYINSGKSMIALSYRKKRPKFNGGDSLYAFNDPNYFDVYPKDLGNIKLPLNEPRRLKITVENIDR